LFDLSGKVSIVTGGHTGLGWEIAEGLAEMGSDVVIVGRRLENCQSAAKRLASLGIKTLAVKCDVSEQQDVVNMVESVMEKFNKVDILVNNAGVSWGAKAEKMQLEDWERVIRVNLTGTFLCCQHIGRVMINNKQGKIINVSSITGLVGMSYLDSVGYVASKGGVLSLTRDLAIKWAPFGVYVNALVPGWIDTHMSELFLQVDEKQQATLASIPLGRIGEYGDFKGAAVFLASGASNFMTGASLVVDGGQSIC
jgi:gluconate 5-dehydrogenase